MVPQKTSEQEKREFLHVILKLFLVKEDLWIFDVGGKEMTFDQDNSNLNFFRNRYTVWEAFQRHLFPLLSLPRHYYITMQTINLTFSLHPFKAKDLEFLRGLMNKLGLLPNLKVLDVSFNAIITLEDFRELGLVG